MTRRKLAIVGIVALLALVAGVAVFALRGESLREKFGRVELGMTYDEVVAILGEPSPANCGNIRAASYDQGWIGSDGTITAVFNDDNRLIVAEFHEAEPVGFFDRALSWFGL